MAFEIITGIYRRLEHKRKLDHKLLTKENTRGSASDAKSYIYKNKNSVI